MAAPGGGEADSALRLFFKKVSMLASKRLADLGDQLNLPDDLKRQIYGVVVCVLYEFSGLIYNRHLEVAFLCEKVAAIFLATIQLLPTPPFPLATAIVFPIMLPAFRAHVLRSARQSCSYRRPLYRLEPVPPQSYMKGVDRSV